MVIESLDIVVYTFMFLVPGYVIEEIIKSIAPGKNNAEGITLIRCLMYSIFNYSVWFSWGNRIIINIFGSSSTWYWVILSISVLITSTVTGFILGCIRANDTIWKIANKWLIKLGVTLNHPIPAAWDYVFKNLNDGAWVTIRMDNDKFIRGRFYTNSFASSDENYRDIYIEDAYTKDKNGGWIKTERTKGVWISPDAIKHIEFYMYKNETQRKDEISNVRDEQEQK